MIECWYCYIQNWSCHQGVVEPDGPEPYWKEQLPNFVGRLRLLLNHKFFEKDVGQYLNPQHCDFTAYCLFHNIFLCEDDYPEKSANLVIISASLFSPLILLIHISNRLNSVLFLIQNFFVLKRNNAKQTFTRFRFRFWSIIFGSLPNFLYYFCFKTFRNSSASSASKLFAKIFLQKFSFIHFRDIGRDDNRRYVL